MSGQAVPNTATRAVKSDGSPAVITAGIGVGATGIAGHEIKTKTNPIASGAAQTIDGDPHRFYCSQPPFSYWLSRLSFPTCSMTSGTRN